jgi:regulator of protease activity HflC (stomatin/prohibitin superfamily)
MDKSIKVAISAVVAAIAAIIFLSATVTRVGVGFIGVKVKLAGSSRGVQDMQIKTGWVMYNPLTEDVVEFPVSVQNVIFTANPHEGNDKNDATTEHGVDESITFSSVEGINANTDVGLSFHIDPMKAPNLYARFKQTDMRALAYGYMRNVIRDAFNEEASKLNVQTIYGAGKTDLIKAVHKRCQETLGVDGVVIDQLTINGAIRLPQNIVDAINNAMAATQNAIQSENKVRQIKAEAEQAITTAHGKAEAARQTAQGEADALIINAKGRAEAKQIEADSETLALKKINANINQQILQYKTIGSWDGKLPTYVGSGSIPMINVK